MSHDIYVRTHTVQLQRKQSRSEQAGGPKWPDYALVFDCESRTTADQTLTFGFWRFCELRNAEYVPLEEGIFHDDHGLSAKEFDLLRKHARATQPDTADDGCKRMRRYSRSKFTKEGFGMAIQAKALIVGFNLPFDLSRIAMDWNPADNGGWTLILKQWRNPKTGRIEPVESFPRVVIKALNSKTSLMNSTRPPVSLRKSKGKRARLWPAGRFLDVRTLLWALRNKSYSLKTACKEFGVAGKLDHKPSGHVDLDEIEYCRQDVRATLALLNAAKREYDLHPIAPGADGMFSPASLAKSYLEELHIWYPSEKVNES